MAHQDISTRSGVLAQVWDAIAATFTALGSTMNLGAAGDARLRRIDALQSRSDEELARMGLTRDGIPAYVFRDLIHI